MAVFSKDLGVDLGTMYTRIAAGDNVVLEEPTVVAIAVDEQKIGFFQLVNAAEFKIGSFAKIGMQASNGFAHKSF